MPIIDSVNMGNLTNYLFVFTDGSVDANWQGASKGFVGDVAVDGLAAAERTSGFVPYAGTIYTNAPTLGAWQKIVNDNPGQAFASVNQVARIAGLQADLSSAFAQINALPVTPGFESRTPQSLNGLNTQNGINETFVINITSGFQVSTQIFITGDAGDVFILRWDQDANPANGYQGQVKFQSGGAIVPQGGLTPANFIHVAGDINSSGGGSNPPLPYPQCPCYNNGAGPIINGGQPFSGGGFFTGYWLTTGDPVTGETAPLSNGIFVGGWYTSTTKFSMTSGTSGVYVSPNPATVAGPCINLQKLISVSGPGGPFVPSPMAPGVSLISPTNPVYQLVITNCGSTNLTGITLTDSTLTIPPLPTTTLAPGQSTSVTVTGTFATGLNCNTATANGTFLTQTVTSTATACYTGFSGPSITVQKLISVDNGASFIPADTAPFPNLVSPTNPLYAFVVTNTGSETLTNITLTDTVLTIPPLPTTTLLPGQSFTVGPITGTFAPGGPHCNTATATGTGLIQTVTDQSTACFVGILGPDILLVKQISVDGGFTFVAAPPAPGPTLVSPTNPVYRYTVTNIGSETLTNLNLVDVPLGTIPLPTTTLLPSQSFSTAPVTGTFALGLHCNTATVSGTGLTQTVMSTSSACYTGEAAPMLQIIKEISVTGPGGPFLPEPPAPGPTLTSPTVPFYRFVVINNGNSPITGLMVMDSSLGMITLPSTTLAPGASFTTTPQAGAFVFGQHCNTVVVTGTSLGLPLTDTSFACFTGEALPPCLQIVKEISVTGAGGPFLPEPAPPFCPTLTSPAVPFFRFVVTNNCTVPITGITVTDSTLGPIVIPTTSLAPGASFTTAPVAGIFAAGQHVNTATVNGLAETVSLTDTSTACYVGVVPGPSILVRKLVSVTCGSNFVESPTLPGPRLFPPNRPKFLIIVTNNGTVPLTGITVVDTLFGPISIPTTTLAPGQSFQVILCGPFIEGPFCNTVTATGFAGTQIVTDSATACFTGGLNAVPVFPDISGPAPQNEIIDRLLETVALEELALSALINAEAQKVQAVSAAGVMGPVEVGDLEAINRAVAEVIAQAAEKEKRLLTKLNRILAHKERGTCGSCDP